MKEKAAPRLPRKPPTQESYRKTYFNGEYHFYPPGTMHPENHIVTIYFHCEEMVGPPESDGVTVRKAICDPNGPDEKWGFPVRYE